MIPKPPADGCPKGTFDGLNTCFCEDHCSWETCRLLNPPQDCLSNIVNEPVWAWNKQKQVWVAQSKYKICYDFVKLYKVNIETGKIDVLGNSAI